MAKARTLVVYFSRTGYTRKVAEALAAAGDADVEAIREAHNRSGLLGYLRSAFEALRKRHVRILPPERDPSRYELVVLGTPVWAQNMCSPMRAYIAANKGKLRQVALFCTQGGSGAEKVLEDMAELCGRRPIASLALSDGEIKRGRYVDKLQRLLIGGRGVG